jgi:hypothetical protein
MATTGTVLEFEPRSVLRRLYNRTYALDAKPIPSRDFFRSLLMCFPVTCMLWAAIIYVAFRLAR